MTHMVTKTNTRQTSPGVSRWLEHAQLLAAAWSLAYGLLALWWTMSRSGFPLGENDPDGLMSLLHGLPADVGAPLFAATALAGAGVALLMARARYVPTVWRSAAVAFGTVTTFGWLLLVPDTRVLAMVGYTPLIIVVGPFDAELRSAFVEAVDAVMLNHLAVIAGGLLWAAATITFARRTSGACLQCGRHHGRLDRLTREGALRWGRIAVAVAVVIPAVYAITRWTWVAGVPLGIDEDFHAEGMASGDLWAGAWLGTFALVGSVLTLGLVQRWGEVFPRWMVGLRGKSVPIRLAVIPAMFVAVIVSAGGLGLIRAGLSGEGVALTWSEWAAVGPAALWPLWGVALAAAAYAYYVRRRGQCRICGQG